MLLLFKLFFSNYQREKVKNNKKMFSCFLALRIGNRIGFSLVEATVNTNK